MGFWGMEVKPGKPHPFHSDNVQGRLYITQATLGLGSSKDRTILQCSVGHKTPIFLCSLLPDRLESCSLNLEFEDELVAFSVIGPRSIHLSGYFVSDERDHLPDEYDSESGEDIAETDSTDESSEYDYGDDYDGDEFILHDDDDEEDDLEMFQCSPVPNSRVVIEEITDDDKLASANGPSKFSKQKNFLENQDNSQRQIVVKRPNDTSVLESEDEYGFPISMSQKSETMIQESLAEQGELRGTKPAKESKKKMSNDIEDATARKRKVENADQDVETERKKKKKKKKQKEKAKEANSYEMDDNDKINELPNSETQPGEVNKQDALDGNENGQSALDVDEDEKSSDKKKKKNKKKKGQDEKGTSKVQTTIAIGGKTNSSLESEDQKVSAKFSKVRSYANGLIIEELAMGKPNGKRASPGSQVSVRYIGKLKKNGQIFDSNVGRAPFKFRLGVGQVIKGWDVGVNGMRTGDKRRLTIPPSMGYGSEGAGKKIPPNSWLVFDVDLVNVR
ncbi:hypothetical protein K2173_026627 [Erythroxylum novogranatense]|uniref:peptidylprolyl isomerase n=1 Tax=Erythroxylum novogranatense TaxID=1862640 RepID=A0AAV8U041_9ROSI|nr:hypothetical protein K2173_026627 [Erythroxylum novogranatense]